MRPRLPHVLAIGVIATIMMFYASYLGTLFIDFWVLLIRPFTLSTPTPEAFTRELDAPIHPIGLILVLSGFGGAVWGMILLARRVAEPALYEALDAESHRIGRHGAALIKTLAIIASFGVAPPTLLSTTWFVVEDIGRVVIFVGLGAMGIVAFVLTRQTSDDPPYLNRAEHPLVRDVTNAIVVLSATSLLSYILFLVGGYRTLSDVLGTPIESNDMEGVLLSAASAIVLARSSLLPRVRHPLVAALALSVFLKPLGIPALTLLAQFIVVTLVVRRIEARETGHRPTSRDAIANGLLVEAGIVSGVLFGRLLFTLTLGTIGWVLGEVAGECIGGVLAAKAAARKTDNGVAVATTGTV